MGLFLDLITDDTYTAKRDIEMKCIITTATTNASTGGATTATRT